MNTTLLPLGDKRHPGSTKPLGAAIIGGGYWGMNYVRMFNELTDARVLAVCDQSAERLNEVALRFPGLYLTTQIDDAASQPDVEAVVACTEASTQLTLKR